jgi:hypothetical protein
MTEINREECAPFFLSIAMKNLNAFQLDQVRHVVLLKFDSKSFSSP